MNIRKNLAVIGALSLLLAGCANDAEIASRNISQAADNFEIYRRIVFYNGITNDYILTVEGLCSQEQTDRKLAITCKTGPAAYKKHFLGLSNNVTYFSEQMESAPSNVFHYRVTFKPAAILPQIDFRN
jgi:hypothetical protein